MKIGTSMKVGFSGTRFGMTAAQRNQIHEVLGDLVTWAHWCGLDVEIHHGDCIGADHEFHHIARTLGVERVVIHPPAT